MSTGPQNIGSARQMAAADPSHGTQRVAAGSIDISPQPPIAVGVVGRRATHLDGALEANVILVDGHDGQPVVLVQIDTLFVDAHSTQSLARYAGMDPGRMVLLASHTHSAPMLTDQLCPTAQYAPERRAAVEVRIGELISQLVNAQRRQCATRFGTVETPVNINRRSVGYFMDLRAARKGSLRLRRRCVMQPDPYGPVDRLLRALRFDDESGHPVAVIWGFAAHPSRQPDRLSVSPDFPGRVRERLRARLGSHVAVLYVPGLAGSTVPLVPFAFPRGVGALLRWMLPFLPYSHAFTTQSFSAWCNQLSSAAEQAVTSSRPVALAPPRIVSGRSKKVFVGPGTGAGVELELRSVAFGPELVLAATSGEMLVEWLDVIPKRLLENVWLTGYLAGRPTYLPTAAVIAEGGYEAEGFLAPFGMSGAFVPDIEATVIAALSEVIGDSMSGSPSGD